MMHAQMHPLLGVGMPAGGLPSLAPSVPHALEPSLDDLARQMASASRRHSRGSLGHRPVNAMRIAKPTSANNSPRSSMVHSRRRTLMTNEVVFPLRQQLPMLDPTYLPNPSHVYGSAYSSPVKKASRPFSWHPPSQPSPTQLQVQTVPMTQYPFPTYNEADIYGQQQQQQHHHMPASQATTYSGYSSPSPAFSPASFIGSSQDTPHYFSPGTWTVPTPQTANKFVVECEPSPCLAAAAFPALPTLPMQSAQVVPETTTTFDWNSFATHGFNRVPTAPPTPEDFPPVQQLLVPTVTTLADEDESLSMDSRQPFKPAGEDEEGDGEILIGMGLYDTPEKAVEDPRLDAYRSSLALLGVTFRPEPEPAGKGLKLEDAWTPPEMDDDDDDDDDEENADADEQDGDDDANNTTAED